MAPFLDPFGNLLPRNPAPGALPPKFPALERDDHIFRLRRPLIFDPKSQF